MVNHDLQTSFVLPLFIGVIVSGIMYNLIGMRLLHVLKQKCSIIAIFKDTIRVLFWDHQDLKPVQKGSLFIYVGCFFLYSTRIMLRSAFMNLTSLIQLTKLSQLVPIVLLFKSG